MEAAHAYHTIAVAALLGPWAVALCLGDWHSRTGLQFVLLLAASVIPSALAVAAARCATVEKSARAALQDEVRRRQLAEDALRQAHKLEAVGRLTGGIAHDFNNHLTVINSNIELLKRRLPESSPQQMRLVDSAMQGVQRAAALTQRLLAFSRQQAVEPEPLDVGRLVAGMLELLRRTLGEAIAIDAVTANGLWLTCIDANQLESAVLNLAVNARDAMPAGGRLTIETANAVLDEAYADAHGDLAAGHYVMVAMHDTGSGMTPDVQARACDPLFSTKPRGQGTGLGLSMVQRFTKQASGHLRIDSEPGMGTTVRLYLPRFMPHPAPHSVHAGAAASRQPGAPETVLVVEDDDGVRTVAVEALREIGYEVLEAPDAMEAVRLLADRGGIDLLFTDVGLPGGVNGRALADAARNIDPALRVLFTTGYTGDPGVPNADSHFLPKPFSLQQLEAKVREVLAVPADSPVTVRTESA